jgi:salicylate hydroxylase
VRPRRRLRVVVAGAGLGGLFAAAALARAGHEVEVVERAPALGEAGAGIQVSPNGAKALAAIGALAAVEARAFQPEAAELRDGESGRLILSIPLGARAEARWGAPYLQVHRADLLAALEGAARRAGARLRLGAAVSGFRQAAGVAALRLEGGGEIEADLAVAADGLRSALREAAFGAVEPRFTGQVAWRATVAASTVPRGLVRPVAAVWAGSGRHLVTYYLRRGELVNLVGVEERAEWAAEDWRAEGDPARLRALFSDFAPAASAPLEAVRRVRVWGLFDRPPPPAWSKGRLVLLGDACHPMLPFMAQGACQAFEDGVALARALAVEDQAPEAALAAYEAARRPRAERVQRLSRDNAGLYHAPAGPRRWLRRGPAALAGRLAPGLAVARLDWLYGWEEPVS